MAETLDHLPSHAWFVPETGIYGSRNHHPPLPQRPDLDLVTHVFSHKHNGSIALLDSYDGSTIAYPNLREMVQSVSSGLRHSLGVAQNDVVLLLLPNTVFFPVVYLGVIAAGAVASPINPLSTAEEIAAHVRRCRPTMAFAHLSNAARLEALGVVTSAVVVPDGLRFDPAAFRTFRELISSDPRRAPRLSIRQTDTAALLCSSGTSGPSKCVVLSHRNLISTVELFVRFEASQYPSQGWANVYLCALPMFHVYGLSLFATGLLSLGTKIVVMRRFVPEAAVRAIERYRVTHVPVVPPILTALIRLQRSRAFNFGSLKQVSSGAAPLSASTIREFTEVFPGVDFIQGYGMTETAAVGTRGFNAGSFRRYDSVGLLAPGMQAKIVDINSGAALAPGGGGGELWLRGPAIVKGYLNDEAATSKAINGDGWLMTGDVARFDEDGYLHILGRLKEIIKYNGYQIAPADLEAVLIAHPEIVDVGVTAAPAEEVGEIPIAFVVRKPGSQLSAVEVISYTSKKVAPYKKVRRVVFVDSIPRSPAGKILRSMLRAGTFAPSRP